jgi:hypothetical protein
MRTVDALLEKVEVKACAGTLSILPSVVAERPVCHHNLVTNPLLCDHE